MEKEGCSRLAHLQSQKVRGIRGDGGTGDPRSRRGVHSQGAVAQSTRRCQSMKEHREDAGGFRQVCGQDRWQARGLGGDGAGLQL